MFLDPFLFSAHLSPFLDHVTFSIPHHLIDHITSHLTSHLTVCQQHMTFLSTNVPVPHCPPNWATYPFYCLPVWDTLLFSPFSLLSHLLFYIIDPHYLVACILGSIFSTGTHLYINPLYLLELGLKPDLVFNPRLVASTALLRRVPLTFESLQSPPLKLSLPLLAL